MGTHVVPGTPLREWLPESSGKQDSNTSRLPCALAISFANRTAGPKSQSWLTMTAASYCRSYVALTRSKAKLTSTPSPALRR